VLEEYREAEVLEQACCALAAPLSPAASWVLREAAAAFAADGPEP